MKYDGILIGQAVRDIRTERGLTIEELSDRVDKSVSHIHQLELGSRKMSVDLLLAFVSVLDTDANRILGIEKTGEACGREQEKVTNLGVHEHWNNPVSKKYSRNLGKKEGIELVKVK